MDADRAVVRAQANLAAFLMMIRVCEGTAGPDGYRMLFGGELFDDLSRHPNVMKQFRWNDGTVGYTTAAGAYQFLYRTWVALAQKLHLPNFGPESQDRAAAELISERRAMEDVAKGRLQAAIDKCGPIWASLPTSRYDQPRRSVAFAVDAYTDAGGMLA